MHTKGPWRFEADMRSERVGDMHASDGYKEYLAGWNIASDTAEVVGIEGIIPDSTGAAEANARLIAAAPCLLEALRTKRDYVADAASGSLTYADSGDGFIAMAKEDLARIDAAIARATGAGA